MSSHTPEELHEPKENRHQMYFNPGGSANWTQISGPYTHSLFIYLYVLRYSVAWECPSCHESGALMAWLRSQWWCHSFTLGSWGWSLGTWHYLAWIFIKSNNYSTGDFPYIKAPSKQHPALPRAPTKCPSESSSVITLHLLLSLRLKYFFAVLNLTFFLNII